jgi:hypothetical protein
MGIVLRCNNCGNVVAVGDIQINDRVIIVDEKVVFCDVYCAEEFISDIEFEVEKFRGRDK